MEIIEADQTHLAIIKELAEKTWPHTFADILSTEQINYMLNWMYSLDSLKTQTTDLAHHFVLAKEHNQYFGYASYELNYKGEPITKIHKIYLLPESQGKGIGRKLINHIGLKAKDQHNTALRLNVNKDNKALTFYEKVGFRRIGTEIIDIGGGFLMEDVIMEIAI